MPSFLPRLCRASATELEVAVRAISDACLQRAYDRLHPSVAKMNRSEATGYIRARARRVVGIELARYFAAQNVFAHRFGDDLAGKVLQRVTQQLLRRMILEPASCSRERAA